MKKKSHGDRKRTAESEDRIREEAHRPRRQFARRDRFVRMNRTNGHSKQEYGRKQRKERKEAECCERDSRENSDLGVDRPGPEQQDQGAERVVNAGVELTHRPPCSKRRRPAICCLPASVLLKSDVSAGSAR